MAAKRVLASVTTSLVGLAVLGWAAASTLPATQGHPLLPADGRVAQVRTSEGELLQLEQAVVPAVALGGALGAAVAGELDPETSVLRATFAPDAEQDVVLLAVVDDALTLHGFSLAGDGRFFEGGIPLIDGASVTGTGHVAAVSSTPFTATVAVDATAGDGCEEVAIDVDLDGDAESLGLTLCPGTGLTDLRAELVGGTAGFADDGEVVPFGDTTLDGGARDWGNASQWQPSAYVPTQRDAFGSSSGAAAAIGLTAVPAALANGDVAVVDEVNDDVVVYRRGADGVAEVVWRGHPGGQVVAVTAVGDLVVAVRTGGSLQAYSADGVRIWDSDVATESIVGSVLPTPGRLAFATLDGGVWLLDAQTGEPLWERRVADRLTSGVVGDERVTFAFDRVGNLFGFVPDGSQPIYGDVPTAFQAVALDEIHSYLGREGAVEAYELQYSTFRWATDLPGRVLALCSGGDEVAVVATRGTVLLDPGTGAIGRGDDRVADAVECGAGATVVALGDVVEVWPTTGDDATLQMPVPVVTGSARGLGPAADGLWVVSPDTFVWWSS